MLTRFAIPAFLVAACSGGGLMPAANETEPLCSGADCTAAEVDRAFEVALEATVAEFKPPPEGQEIAPEAFLALHRRMLVLLGSAGTEELAEFAAPIALDLDGYEADTAYCGIEYGTDSRWAARKNPGDCLNRVCFQHDRCYSTIGNATMQCLWSYRTQVCDDAFFTGFAGCRYHPTCGGACLTVERLARGYGVAYAALAGASNFAERQSRCTAASCDALECDEMEDCMPGTSGCNKLFCGVRLTAGCGGQIDCATCGHRRMCTLNRDCQSGVCGGGERGFTARCQTPTCADAMLNATESDTDCGGDCDGCEIGRACRADDDCAVGSCVGGACFACRHDCALAQLRCLDPATQQTCGQFDTDPCREWGDARGCDCVDDACDTCTSGCIAFGTTQCLDGSTQQTCGNHDGDSCLEWGGNTTCNCVGDACDTCTNGCTTLGATKCLDGSTRQTCGNHDGDSCLEWGGNTTCNCVGDTCVPDCTSNWCQSGSHASGTYCDGNDHVTCGTASGCTVVSARNTCGSGTACSGGTCVPNCTSNWCRSNGTTSGTYCDGNDRVTCGTVTGCTVVSARNTCGSGTTCSGGTCVPDCTSNWCQSGSHASGTYCDGNDRVTCGTASGCTVVSARIPCGSGTTCSGGTCVADCGCACDGCPFANERCTSSNVCEVCVKGGGNCDVSVDASLAQYYKGNSLVGTPGTCNPLGAAGWHTGPTVNNISLKWTSTSGCALPAVSSPTSYASENVRWTFTVPIAAYYTVEAKIAASGYLCGSTTTRYASGVTYALLRQGDTPLQAPTSNPANNAGAWMNPWGGTYAVWLPAGTHTLILYDRASDVTNGCPGTGTKWIIADTVRVRFDRAQ